MLAQKCTRGLFITFEGGEGSGKTTQVRYLSDTLSAAGIPHITTREPGGTPLAEKLRGLVVESGATPWLPESEMLLFLAARLEHTHRVILPALEQGNIVLCDRFHDSSRAYQGIARGLGVALYDQLHRLMLGSLRPDLTFLLDIDAEVGLKRAATRRGKETRFEELGLDFHTRLRAGFLSLAANEPERIHVIDAAQNVDAVQAQIFKVWRNHQ
jgi:dTMP kinase